MKFPSTRNPYLADIYYGIQEQLKFMSADIGSEFGLRLITQSRREEFIKEFMDLPLSERDTAIFNDFCGPEPKNCMYAYTLYTERSSIKYTLHYLLGETNTVASMNVIQPKLVQAGEDMFVMDAFPEHPLGAFQAFRPEYPIQPFEPESIWKSKVIEIRKEYVKQLEELFGQEMLWSTKLRVCSNGDIETFLDEISKTFPASSLDRLEISLHKRDQTTNPVPLARTLEVEDRDFRSSTLFMLHRDQSISMHTVLRGLGSGYETRHRILESDLPRIRFSDFSIMFGRAVDEQKDATVEEMLEALPDFPKGV